LSSADFKKLSKVGNGSVHYCVQKSDIYLMNEHPVEKIKNNNWRYNGVIVPLLSLCCPYDVPGVQKSHLRVLPNETELSIDDLDRRVCVWESTSSFFFCYSK